MEYLTVIDAKTALGNSAVYNMFEGVDDETMRLVAIKMWRAGVSPEDMARLCGLFSKPQINDEIRARMRKF